MLIRVYLPDGIDIEHLTILPGQDPLDEIFLNFGEYLEYDVIREEA